MDYPRGYILRDCSLVCPQCQAIFGMRVMADLPPVTDVDVIEGDMHRVLPHAALRATLICVCPECGYADWTTRFGRSLINPVLVQPCADISFSRKFALAVKQSRESGIHPLDIAYIALNGLYCAREAGEPYESWLELCVYEQSRGLDPDNLLVETGTDHLIMAELWRQLRCFDEAIAEYDKARMDGTVAEPLIEHQMRLVQAGDCQPARLPPYLVRLIFPEAAELALSPQVKPEDFNQVIVQTPNAFTMFEADGTGNLVAPAREKRPNWARQASCELPITVQIEVDGDDANIDVPQFDEPAAVTAQPSPEVVEPATQVVESPAPSEAPVAAPSPTEIVPLPAALQKQSIALPQAASTVSLVHSSETTVVSMAISPSTVKSAETPKTASAKSDEPADSTQKAVKRALKVVRSGIDPDPNDKFPVVQLTDEEAANYRAAQQYHDDDQDEYDDEDLAGTAQAAAKSPEDAIAQVESFLNLTRQPSYQNWIRGYRK